MLTYNVKDFGATGNGTTNDTAAIQAALDAAHAAGGGKVYIPAGTYILTGTGDASDGAVRVYSNTELYGDGIGTTELKLQDGFSSKITGMIRTPVGEVTTDVIIHDLTINGNRANSTADVDGIMTGVLPGSPEQDNRILIERVEIHDVSRIAFNPHEQTTNLTIRDCVAHHNSWDGFVGDFVSNAVYENNVAYSNDRHGFNIVTHSHDVLLLNNTAYDNAYYGIISQRGAGSDTIPGWADMLNNNILIQNNTVYGNDRGIVLKQTEESQVVGNNVHDNLREGIYLEGARENVIDGNTVAAVSDAIELRNYSGSLGGPGDSYGNVIVNNTLTSTTAYDIVESGTTTVNNSYADNTLTGPVKLGTTAHLVDDAATLPYTHITVTAELPSIYAVPVPKDLIISGTDAVDNLTGGDGNDSIKGRLGNDLINGGKGNDYIEGNDGNDTLTGGLGADRLKGGSGVDTYVYHTLAEGGDTILDFRPKSGEIIDLADVLGFSGSYNTSHSFTDGFLRLAQNGADVELYLDKDGLAGSAAHEVLFLTLLSADVTQIGLSNFKLASDTLPIPDPEPVPEPIPVPVPPPVSGVPTEGNDILTGTDNAETIKGRGGDDVIYGGAGTDSIEGNNGNDRIYGGLGTDTLKGGAGADVFVYENLLEGGDTILDLRSDDHIDLAKLLEDFSGSVPSTTDQLFAEGYLITEKIGTNTVSLSFDQDGQVGTLTAVHLANITLDVGKEFDPNSIVI